MEEQHKRSKFGFSGLSVGHTTTKWNDHNVALTTMEAGSINLHAHRDVNAAGTLFTAHTGDIRVHGDRTTNIDMVQTTEYLKSHGWNVGLTASMGGFAGSVINTDVANAALKGEDLATAIRQQSPLLDSLNTLSKSKGTLGTGMSIINTASQAANVSSAVKGGSSVGDALFGTPRIGITASAFSQKQTWQENYPSIFNAPTGTVSLTSGKGTNILGGAKVTAGKDIILDGGTGKLLISAGPAESTSKGKSGGASLTFGGGGISVGANYAQNKGNGITYDPAQFQASNTLYIKAGNGADLLGVQGIAKHIATDVKGDFNLVTLQNEYKSKNAGISGSIGTHGGSIGISGGNTNRHFSDNVSQLIGTESVRTNVTGNTNLVGSTIAQGTYDSNNIFHDGGNLILNTGTLTYSDLKDKDSSFQGGINIGTGYDPKTGITSDGTFGGNIDYSNIEGSTKATLGNGVVVIKNGQKQDAIMPMEQLANLNRDVNANQIITKRDEQRGEITVPLAAFSNPKGFAKDAVNGIQIATNALAGAVANVFPEGLNPVQTRQLSEALTRTPAEAKALAAKFKGRGLTAKEEAAIEALFRGDKNIVQVTKELSKEARNEVFYQVGVFFDGTWKDTAQDKPGSESNVAVLEDLYGREGRSFYISGIGTGNWLDQYLCGATGCGGEARQNKALNDVSVAYNGEGKGKILVFDLIGFSRGASTTRDFSNLVQTSGVPGAVSSDMLFVRSELLFDTVGAYGYPFNGVDLGKNLTTSSSVGIAIHAVALDELRDAFGLQSVLYSNGKAPSNVIEKSFPGAHTDVGGTYLNGEQGKLTGLSYIPLQWVHEQAVKNGVPFLPLPETRKPSPELQKAYSYYLISGNKSALNNYIHSESTILNSGSKRIIYYPNDRLK